MLCMLAFVKEYTIDLWEVNYAENHALPGFSLSPQLGRASFPASKSSDAF